MEGARMSKRAVWELVKKNEHYTRHQPPADYYADTYQCSHCHNRVNNSEGLSERCPWCKATMSKEDA